ncbi:tyrosine-type recombinase/integrase [Chelatococcus sp. GCM10030263]|uniref:tyrosine-type recombinase/integrase n=1 Tax=Chelatococcus sp. GCM10030263 TaxID=3273387 RepID=UPI00360807DB
MPGRKAAPPRLYPRERAGRPTVWVILHRGREISTGCREEDVEGAARFLEEYLGSLHNPTTGASSPATVNLSDLITFYTRQKKPPDDASPETLERFEEMLGMADTLMDWWGDKTLAAVKGQSCRDYTAWRISQPLKQAKSKEALKKRISPATARRELEVLRAAINLYHKEFTLDFVPKVTLPEKSAPRERWFTRQEVARLLAASLGFIWDGDQGAWRPERRDKVTRTRRRHIARFLLIGVYTGTRHKAIERLQWHANTTGGWIDLDRGVLYRRGVGERETKKRRPPARLPHRLMPHLQRWSRIDAEADRWRDEATVFVIHKPDGSPLAGRIRSGWEGIVADAGLGPEVVPHVMRHTAATWQMHAGTDLWEAAGSLGMTVEQLQEGYGHHHPDFQEGAAGAFGGRR